MNHSGRRVDNIKIAYIGGGSRGWAWGLMSDLVSESDISGDVYLYDIDFEAAKSNEIIGNKFNECDGAKSRWIYHACQTAKEAYKDADFVIISILPGTFDEMESDVHAPEKYGIYQSVGDTSGPGGIIRAMRCVPMFEEIAENIKNYCPKAWVINYTNPMTLCVKTLYRVFPDIKAFGCCHEVFGTQRLLMQALEKINDIKVEDRTEIKVNPVAVNHFTWLKSAYYKNIDLIPVYTKFVDKYYDTGYSEGHSDANWVTSVDYTTQRVKFDLFKRYGVIAAAGDRHLSEFCEGKWYLKDPETVKQWGFALTSVAWRKDGLKERLEKSKGYMDGTMELKITCTGEEGVKQMRAILGLTHLVTNVNMPNIGQIPNLPMGAVVETNAVFSDGTVTPVMAGEVPGQIYPLVSRVCGAQEELSRGIAERNLDIIFNCFANDPLVTCSLAEAKELFGEMILNTKKYLSMYDLSCLK